MRIILIERYHKKAHDAFQIRIFKRCIHVLVWVTPLQLTDHFRCTLPSTVLVSTQHTFPLHSLPPLNSLPPLQQVLFDKLAATASDTIAATLSTEKLLNISIFFFKQGPGHKRSDNRRKRFLSLCVLYMTLLKLTKSYNEQIRKNRSRSLWRLVWQGPEPKVHLDFN